MIEIGDRVEVVEVGAYYPTNNGAAETMKATKWTPNVPPSKNEEYLVKNKTEPLYVDEKFIFLIEKDDREFLVGESGLKKIREWDDEVNP